MVRVFHLVRLRDESGVSGTGIVAEGVEFSSGKVVIQWLSKYQSITIYGSIAEAEAIHGHAGATQIVFDDKKL